MSLIWTEVFFIDFIVSFTNKFFQSSAYAFQYLVQHVFHRGLRFNNAILYKLELDCISITSALIQWLSLSSVTSAVWIKHIFGRSLRSIRAIVFKFTSYIINDLTHHSIKSLKKFANYFFIYADFKISIGQGSCSTEAFLVKF